MLDVLYTIIIVIEVFLQPQFILVVIVQVGLVENAQHLVQAIVDLPMGLWFFPFFFNQFTKVVHILQKSKLILCFFPPPSQFPVPVVVLCCQQLFVFQLVYQLDRLSVKTPGMLLPT